MTTVEGRMLKFLTEEEVYKIIKLCNAIGIFEVRWQDLFPYFPQFITDYNSERITEIGPYLAKLSTKV